VKTFPIYPRAFIFCDKKSGTCRFRVDAAKDGSIPLENAANVLAMQCAFRNHAPEDYTLVVVPPASLLDKVTKRAQVLIDAGRPSTPRYLTKRQTEVLDGLQRKLSNKEIGVQLNISERTVKLHVSILLAKFNVHDRVSLVLEAVGHLPGTASQIQRFDSGESVGRPYRWTKGGTLSSLSVEILE
jgi:DNA-binding CsgD family transcriptional regulator